ncbi:MAG: hypothetical protein AAF694_30480, partial [Bacteroidota bacterium]
GYFATMFLHLAVAKSVPVDTPVLLTSTYSSFLIWVGLMIMVFLVKRAWISWAVLLLISGLGALLIFL